MPTRLTSYMAFILFVALVVYWSGNHEFEGQKLEEYSDLAGTQGRNQQSTPTVSILPSSPAIVVSNVAIVHALQKETVEYVQLMLTALRYHNGRVDGAYDENTRASLVRFQFDHSIEITGTIDQATLSRLVQYE